MPRALKSKLLALAAVGLVAGLASGTYAAFSSSTANSGNTFSAASSFVNCTAPSPSWVTGIEHGVVSTSGGGLFDYAVGATADSAVKRSGSYSVRVNVPSGGNAYAGKAISGSTVVMRFALRFGTLPATNIASLATTYVTAGNNLQLGYRASDQRLTLAYGSNSAESASPIAADTWYVIDMRATLGSNPRTGDWQIDGVAQPSVSSSEPAASNTIVGVGSIATGDAYVANYDDIVVSTEAADYPLGPGRVLGLSPDGVATHSNSGNFRTQSGALIDANSWQLVDEVPMSSTADNVQQRTASGTSYLGFTFENPTTTCVRAVSAVLAYRSANNNANNGKTSIFDSSAERVVFSGNMTGNTLMYKSAVVDPATSPWTSAAVDGLITRVGYSTDVNPIPFWESLLLEYETPEG